MSGPTARGGAHGRVPAGRRPDRRIERPGRGGRRRSRGRLRARHCGTTATPRGLRRVQFAPGRAAFSTVPASAPAGDKLRRAPRSPGCPISCRRDLILSLSRPSPLPCRETPPPHPVTIEFLKSLLAADLAAVDHALRARARLRRRAGPRRSPSTSSTAAASGCARRSPAVGARLRRRGRVQHTLAAVVEMIHTATLLHDDVVDESSLRRGHATANATFGNAAACWSATSSIRARSS